jgi:hypothetical protein
VLGIQKEDNRMQEQTGRLHVSPVLPTGNRTALSGGPKIYILRVKEEGGRREGERERERERDS